MASASTIWTRDESSELLRLAIQVGGIGIFDTDLERKRTRFSPELCVILGLPAGTEMDYADSSRIVDERDRAAVNAIMEAARNASDEGAWNSDPPNRATRWNSPLDLREWTAVLSRHGQRAAGRALNRHCH